MSLLGIAIVGKKNEPLYLCDCTKLTSIHDDDNENDATPTASPPGQPGNTAVNDPFGFLLQSSSTSTTASSSQPQGQSLEIEQQFILHAALDRLEEQVGASHPDGTMPLRKAVRSGNSNSSTAAASPTATNNNNKKSHHHHHLGPPAGQWLGLLTVQDAGSGGVLCAYGYVTATNLKVLALAAHPVAASAAATRRALEQQGRAVRTLCTAVHGHVITYLLNPFRELHETCLQSASLDRHVRQAVQAYQEQTPHQTV